MWRSDVQIDKSIEAGGDDGDDIEKEVHSLLFISSWWPNTPV